jgi:hypothetical protein
MIYLFSLSIGTVNLFYNLKRVAAKLPLYLHDSVI